jgi:cytochrome c biogenesis protein CcdA
LVGKLQFSACAAGVLGYLILFIFQAFKEESFSSRFHPLSVVIEVSSSFLLCGQFVGLLITYLLPKMVFLSVVLGLLTGLLGGLFTLTEISSREFSPFQSDRRGF